MLHYAWKEEEMKDFEWLDLKGGGRERFLVVAFHSRRKCFKSMAFFHGKSIRILWMKPPRASDAHKGREREEKGGVNQSQFLNENFSVTAF